MSLLSSIFGEKKQKATKGSDLFDKSAALPERPQHKPLPPRDTKKRKSEDDEDDQEGDKEEPLKDQVLSRKDRKKQKQKQQKVDEEKLLLVKEKEEQPSTTKKTDLDTKSKKVDQHMEKKKKKIDKPKQDKKQEKASSDSDSDSSNDGNKDKTAEEKAEGQNSDKKNIKDSAKEPVQEEEKDDEPEEDNTTDQNDNSKDAEERTIFVGNLPLATTSRRSLANLFKDCGKIESTRIRSVPVKGIKIPANRKGDQNLVKKVCANTKQYDETLTSTVLGYVVFHSKESVAKALEKNNTTTVDKILLKVDTAVPTVDPSRSVFCGNLPYSTDEASLKEHFVKGCSLTPSDVLSARIVRDKETFQCKGFGYVLFKEKDMVSAALKLNNCMYKKKQVRVMVCGKRFKKKKVAVPTRTMSTAKQPPEKLSAGALRRILAKQQTEAETINKRKRGDTKKQQAPAVAGKKVPQKGGAGLSRRAVAEKKVDKRVKKIQRRISKGMGKKKSR
jgi:nucleolar protein 12